MTLGKIECWAGGETSDFWVFHLLEIEWNEQVENENTKIFVEFRYLVPVIGKVLQLDTNWKWRLIENSWHLFLCVCVCSCACVAVLKVHGTFSNAMQIAYTQCVMLVAMCKLSTEQPLFYLRTENPLKIHKHRRGITGKRQWMFNNLGRVH